MWPEKILVLHFSGQWPVNLKKSKLALLRIKGLRLARSVLSEGKLTLKTAWSSVTRVRYERGMWHNTF